VLPRGRVYRLPTDAEWSVGVGLQGEEGDNPEEKDRSSYIRGARLYPWGKEWPPPKGAGNYAGEECKSKCEFSFSGAQLWLRSRFREPEWIKGYNDGYPRTSPVGSFAANANGLYDMGGNVRQWCEDRENARETYRVLRGASWRDYIPDDLFPSHRDYGDPDHGRGADTGFRCVVGAESSR